jgi:concentrative nucleoside transporter, CNT family
VSIKPVIHAIGWAWNNSVVKVVDFIPEKFRLPLGALGTILIILIGTFTSPQSSDNTNANRAVSLFGLVVFIGVFYVTSNNRKMINWHTVIVGMLAQFILALFVLRTKTGVSLPFLLAQSPKFINGFHQRSLGVSQRLSPSSPPED